MMPSSRSLLLVGLLFLLAVLLLKAELTLRYKFISGMSARHTLIQAPRVENSTSEEQANEQVVKLLLTYTKFVGLLLPKFETQDQMVRLAASLVDCDYKCEWSSNKADYNRSDAVIFHLYNNLENKDFVFSKLPTRYNVDQKWILMAREPPAFYYPEQLKLLNGMFNLSMTFQSKADISIPYGGFFKRENNLTDDEDYMKNRTRKVAWLVSSCITSSRREKYVEQLQRYINVDIYGKCGKSVDEVAELEKLAAKYKFYIAFENSDCEDYITEKFWKPLSLGMIPIVRGHKVNYKRFAPPNSYIHADSYLTPARLAKHLEEISLDANLFSKYHKWRQNYEAGYKQFTMNERWMCDLCTQVHTAPHKTFDVYKQFSESTQCFAHVDDHGRKEIG